MQQIAQQPVPVMGWLFGVSAEAAQQAYCGIPQNMTEAGYVEGRSDSDSSIIGRTEYTDQLPAMAADLVARSMRL